MLRADREEGLTSLKLGFSTAAWKLAPCDCFIGWRPQLREKSLRLVVDNPRFLILPGITIPNLGSHILSLVRRQLPQDWTERYNTTPMPIGTFVETPHFTGAVYRASGWIHVGTIQRRGRYDRDKLYDKPRRDGLAPVPQKRLEAHSQSVKSAAPSPPDRSLTDDPALLGGSAVRRDLLRLALG